VEYADETAFLYFQRVCRIQLGRQSFGNRAVIGCVAIHRYTYHAAHRAAIQFIRNGVHHAARKWATRRASVVVIIQAQAIDRLNHLYLSVNADGQIQVGGRVMAFAQGQLNAF